MTFPVPDHPVELETWLATIGEVFAPIGARESGCTAYGVEIAGDRWFVKAAPTASRAQLDGAVAVHARVRHPAIVPLVADFAVAGGHAVVHPWVEGVNLRDTDGALDAFRALPLGESLRAYDDLLDAHVAVAAAGLVAVDLYTGSLLHDTATGRLHVIDVDLYRAPYVLDVDRQDGSSTLMPPEELHRGSAVGEPATVYTLARLALHLGCVRTQPLVDVALRATRALSEERYPDVAAYAHAWRAAARA